MNRLRLFLSLVWRVNPWVSNSPGFEGRTVRFGISDAWGIASTVHRRRE